MAKTSPGDLDLSMASGTSVSFQQQQQSVGTSPSASSDFKLKCSKNFLMKMSKEYAKRIKATLLEMEMGVVWGVAGVAIIIFVFAAIWFIDPALLTLVLQFRKVVSSKFVSEAKPYGPPWKPLTKLIKDSKISSPSRSHDEQLARLYPNVRGCGYPPKLNCEEFFSTYGTLGAEFDCWVSTNDPTIAMTELNLSKAKHEVMLSLIPLLIFILAVLYAFCRMGIFSICNPFRSCCPRPQDTKAAITNLTPRRLYDYKKAIMVQRGEVQLPEEGLTSPKPSIQVNRALSPPVRPTTADQPPDPIPVSSRSSIEVKGHDDQVNGEIFSYHAASNAEKDDYGVPEEDFQGFSCLSDTSSLASWTRNAKVTWVTNSNKREKLNDGLAKPSSGKLVSEKLNIDPGSIDSFREELLDLHTDKDLFCDPPDYEDIVSVRSVHGMTSSKKED